MDALVDHHHYTNDSSEPNGSCTHSNCCVIQDIPEEIHNDITYDANLDHDILLLVCYLSLVIVFRHLLDLYHVFSAQTMMDTVILNVPGSYLSIAGCAILVSDH